MATLWLYRCSKCGVEWSLLSKRYELGPSQWGSIRHTCFTCQTFLTIARSVDSSSWRNWNPSRHPELAQNPIMSDLVSDIERQLASRRPLTPMTLHFDRIACPTCRDPMSTEPFGERPMKCPSCKEYAGVNPDPDVIHMV
jgi:hypothetical protein